MSLFTKLFPRTKQAPRFNYAFNSGGMIPPDRTADGFLRAYSEIGWLYAVVFRIALGCGEVKWRLYNGSERSQRTQVAKHPLLSLLDTINPFQTGSEFIELHQIYMDLIGESFWILNYNALGEPAEIWIPQPNKMSVVPDRNKFIKGYVYGSGQDAIPFDVNEVIHHKYPNPLNQYRGLGPAQAIAVDLDAEMYSGQWNRNFFFNSARPDGVIQFDYNLSDEQFGKLSKQWNEKYKGTSKAHQVALLEGGGKYVQIANSVKDMDFGALKRLTRDVILGVYGMPLSVMGISENVNKANAEAGDYTFARWIVKPRLNRIKNKLNEQFVSKFRKAANLELDFDEVVPETIEQKMLLAESGLRASYLTRNEARQMRGMDVLPPEVGDVLLTPMNLIETPADGSPVRNPPTPAAPPAVAPEETEPEELPEESPGKKSLTVDHKRAHWEAFARKTEREEQSFQRVFREVFAHQKTAVADAYARTGALNETILISEQAVANDAKRFQGAIEMVYHSGFEDAVSGSKTLKQLDEAALTWIWKRSLKLVKDINTTTLEEIRAQLAAGFEAGESIQQLTSRIVGYFDGNAQYRAERVSRTEVIAANNEGILDRYEKEGVEESEFYASPAACVECTALNGEIHKTKESHAIIPVHPNCQCRWFAVEE